MSRILIIEDEAAMRAALQDCLAAEGHRILTAEDGESGLKRGLEQRPDLILLDVMMPKLDGFAVAREFRRLGSDVPILMLTAKGFVQDKVAGLDAGADDYLVKPFSTDELLARVRAALRRVSRRRRVPEMLTLGNVRIDFVKQEAWRTQSVARRGKSGKEALPLTAREFAMLRLLAEAAGEPVSRERFLDIVWGYTAFPTTRTVDNHIAGLRGKIEDDPENPRWLLTVHGVGYRLEVPEITNP